MNNTILLVEDTESERGGGRHDFRDLPAARRCPSRYRASRGRVANPRWVRDDPPGRRRRFVRSSASRSRSSAIECSRRRTRSTRSAKPSTKHHVGAIALLLTDVVMPGMSGPELARLLTVDRPATRVLMMSGYTDDALVRHGALQSSIAYIQKPTTLSKLARKVRIALALDAG